MILEAFLETRPVLGTARRSVLLEVAEDHDGRRLHVEDHPPTPSSPLLPPTDQKFSMVVSRGACVMM